MKGLFLAIVAFSLALCSRADVPVYAYVVCNDDGTQIAASENAPAEIVSKLNLVFSQVCIDFTLVHVGVITNGDWMSICGTNVAQYTSLCATTNSTGGIELYFVEEIDDCTAFSISSGIVISQEANWRTVAHEVGHRCGLNDIYDAHDGTSLRVTGGSTLARIPDDYGRPAASISHAQRLRRLLMYGYRSDTKLAISGGDIYGLGWTERINPANNEHEEVLDLFNVEIGFWSHGTRTPSCQ